MHIKQIENGYLEIRNKVNCKRTCACGTYKFEPVSFAFDIDKIDKKLERQYGDTATDEYP